MESSIPKPVFPNSHGPAVIPSTLEVRQLTNSEYPIYPAHLREQSGASAPAEPYFQKLDIQDLVIEDFDTLDRARRAAFYVYTVAEFADCLQKGTYDIYKLRDLQDAVCIILTSFEVYPRHKFLMVHYLAGKRCKPHIAAIKRAVWDLADRTNCDGVLYMAHNPIYAKHIGGKQLSVLYAMER